MYCTVHTGVGDFSVKNILSIVPLLQVYPGAPTNQRWNSRSKIQRTLESAGNQMFQPLTLNCDLGLEPACCHPLAELNILPKNMKTLSR